MIAVLADDLTSALDGAAPFAARLLAARVVLDASAVDSAGVVVISVDLDSRFLDPVMAEERFAAAACLPGARVLYKTVDSTLRGNIGAEIRGALRGSRRRRAVVAPAFPAAGRITLGGRQLVDGVPLERTLFADDPRTPVTSSRVADLLVGLDPTSFEMHDAAHDRDLDSLVSSLGLGPDLLRVGSPRRASRAPWRGRSRGPAGRHVPGATRPNGCSWSWVYCTRSTSRRSSAWRAPGRRSSASTRAHTPRLGRRCCLASVRLRPDRLPSHTAGPLSGRRGRLGAARPRPRGHCRRMRNVVRRTRGHRRRHGPAHCRRAPEPAPSTSQARSSLASPLGVLRGPDRSIRFATKAGGFGHPDTLLACVHRLRSPQDLAR